MPLTLMVSYELTPSLCRIDGIVYDPVSGAKTSEIHQGSLTGAQAYNKLKELHAQYAPLGSMSIYLESSLEKLFDALQQQAAATDTSNRPIKNTSSFKKSPVVYHDNIAKVNTHNRSYGRRRGQRVKQFPWNR